MSSGACRALASLLLTLVATSVLALPAGAKTDALNESSTVTYTVRPSEGRIDVQILFTLATKTGAPFPEGEWGPIVVEERARPSVSSGFSLVRPSLDAPGPWKLLNVNAPRIEGGERARLVLSYSIDASPTLDDDVLADTPARVDGSYFYFCAVGQDADAGSVKVRVNDSGNWQLTQSGTPLETWRENGLQSGTTRTPGEVFTCIEGVRQGRLAVDTFIGPADRQFVLQAWRDKANWLSAAKSTSPPALDAIHAFLGQDIPGEGPVTIRMAPRRELGGYASAHNTPAIVQLDEDGGVRDPEHELAHAWFTTDTFVELWMREGMALWTASAMQGETCAPAGDNAAGLELSDWQVVRPTSAGDPEQVIADQDAAACGIVSAVAARMPEAQWQEVIGSLLNAETKYIGSGGPEAASNPIVDYREWLDAVDERGLVPAAADPAFASNLDDLDFAQDLLDTYGVIPSGTALSERSAARAYYHQFLADAAPYGLSAPLAVRKSMDDWDFSEATAALNASYEVFEALTAANDLVPTAGLIRLFERPFEQAESIDEIEAVRVEAVDIREEAAELVIPLGELAAVTPEGWGQPQVITSAVDARRFDDAKAAITPATTIATAMSAADAFLPEAGLLEAFRPGYERATTLAQLSELQDEAGRIRTQAELTGKSLDGLRSEVGEDGWRIPAAVTDLVEAGQITTARTVIEDARAVLKAATEADLALPQAQLRAEFKERFESVGSAAEMAALKSDAELRRDEARAVGAALASLNALVPDWKIPEIVTQPVEDRDFTTAAVTAAAAQKWVEAAAKADADWPGFDALARAQVAFENAQSLEDLEAGKDLAVQWSQAAEYIRRAESAVAADRDLLTSFGLWGVDLDTPLEQARQAARDAQLDTAINKSSEVIATVNNGSSSGSLRLAGIVFFGIAVLGVLGLWVILRRQSGPPWARQSRPHWEEPKKSLPWRRGKHGP